MTTSTYKTCLLSCPALARVPAKCHAQCCWRAVNWGHLSGELCNPQCLGLGVDGTTDLQLLPGSHNYGVQIFLPFCFHSTKRLHFLEMCRVSEIWMETLGIFILQSKNPEIRGDFDLTVSWSGPKSHWPTSSANYGHGQTGVCSDVGV